MQTVSITTAKTRLNDLVDEARRTHEHVTITKNGEPAAVMVSADEWESIQETLFWQSQPDIHQDIEDGRAAHEAGESFGEERVRARYGVELTPPAIKSLDRIPPRYLGAILEFTYGALAESPQRVGKPLSRDFEGLHSARRGDYRILYEIRDAERVVLIHRVNHRASVYWPG
jgi:prevent-host-death family protein